jgi:hypothetical protein
MQRIFFAFSYQYAAKLRWYVECLRQTCTRLGCEAVIASDVVSDSHVLNHVSECIDQCELGFFDVTGMNPNVLIEYGIGYNSDKPSFLLLNPQLNVLHIDNGVFGKKEVPIPLPADLEGILRREYIGAETLSKEIERVIDQHLRHPAREGEVMAGRIVEKLKAIGPSNMSTIAVSVGKSIDEVRPILKGLVATDRVVREGHAKGSKYRSS